eukprot:232391_1
MVEVSNSIREIMVLIEVILCYFLTPFVIYWYIKFNKLSHSIMFQKRHPNILKFTGIITIYWFSCAMPLVSIAFAELDRFKGNIQIVLDRLNVFFYPIGTAGIFITIAWRFWHIYFDLKYSSSQKNSEWKYYLDCKHSERVFWLVYRKSYGSYFATKSIFIKIYCINVFIMIITYQIVIGTPYIMLGHGISILSHSLCIVIMLSIWWKLPAYSDDLYVKKEVKLVSIILCASQAAADISMAFCFILRYNVIFMSVCMSGSFLIWSVALVSFWWIPKRVAQIELEHQLLRTSLSMSSSSSSELASISEFKSGMTNKERDKRKFNNTLRRLSQDSTKRTRGHDFYTIASNPSTFKLLMQHLGKEFSMECLLCFVETIQYKFALKKRCDLIDVELIDDDMDVSQPPMAEAAPMSFIVKTGFENISKYKRNDDPATLVKEAKNVCLQLFQKYIDIGSELAVNISYESRSRLKNLMSDISFFMEVNSTPNDLFKIFDDVSTEMFRLMHGAYVRFKMKPSFDEVVEALQDASS